MELRHPGATYIHREKRRSEEHSFIIERPLRWMLSAIITKGGVRNGRSLEQITRRKKAEVLVTRTTVLLEGVLPVEPDSCDNDAFKLHVTNSDVAHKRGKVCGTGQEKHENLHVCMSFVQHVQRREKVEKQGGKKRQGE